MINFSYERQIIDFKNIRGCTSAIYDGTLVGVMEEVLTERCRL